MTPEMASEPYTAEALPLRISTRSISEVGMFEISVKLLLPPIGLRIVGDAPAVHQHQRVIGPKAAQIDRLRARRESVGVLIVVERPQILGERGHDVGDGREAADW